MFHPCAALCAALAAPVAAQEYALVGSGGCDGTDTHCNEPSSFKPTDLQGVQIAADGTLSLSGAPISAGPAPTWLTANRGPNMYATLSGSGEGNGTMAGYAARPGTGAPAWTAAGTAKTKGTAPVHATVDRTGRWLVVANYGGCDNCSAPDGSVAVLPLSAGKLSGDAVTEVKHHGSSVDKDRQNCAHVHSAYTSRHHDVAYICDLGMDLVFTYAIDPSTGQLKQLGTVNASRLGAGPRHMALHPDGHTVYVVEEMGNMVVAYGVDQRTGALESPPKQVIASGPVPVPDPGCKAAELAMRGNLLFVSNRGDVDACNTLQGFTVAADGRLQAAGAPVSSECRFPRGMEFTPSGRYLLVAGQGDGKLNSFAVSTSGGLRKAGSLDGLAAPTTIAFA